MRGRERGGRGNKTMEGPRSANVGCSNPTVLCNKQSDFNLARTRRLKGHCVSIGTLLLFGVLQSFRSKQLLRYTFGAVAFLSGSLWCAGQSFSSLPSPSVWRLNPARSDFGGGPTIKEDVVTVLACSPSLFQYKEHEVMGSGDVADLSWSGPLDGSLQKVEGGRGSKASFTAQGEARFEIHRGPLELASFSLSSDGKTLTQVVTLQWKYGKEQHAIWVYERVK